MQPKLPQAPHALGTLGAQLVGEHLPDTLIGLAVTSMRLKINEVAAVAVFACAFNGPVCMHEVLTKGPHNRSAWHILPWHGMEQVTATIIEQLQEPVLDKVGKHWLTKPVKALLPDRSHGQHFHLRSLSGSHLKGPGSHLSFKLPIFIALV